MSSNGDWRIVVGFEAQRDLWTFGWEQNREVGGVVCGRFETGGINRHDDGRSLFVRRIFRSDFGGDETSVDIDFNSIAGLQTIMTNTPRTGGGGGRTGADDPGVFVGSIHSHPGLDRLRMLSKSDLRAATKNAQNQPTALASKPWLSALATSGESWEAGEPTEDWQNPTYDWHLVRADGTVIKPTVSYMSEVEWLVEEGQRALIGAD